jgi:hypothetical protein
MKEPDAARARRSERLRLRVGRLVRRVVSVLTWAGGLALAAFGVVFSFANYPSVAISVVLLILLAIGHSERRRRQKWNAWERARKQDRA